ncbi:MAG: ATP synthase F1 subunit delta [bacterium]
MAIEPVAVENWAEALHRAAKKANQLESVLNDANALRDIYLRQRKTAAFLEGPQFRTQDKQDFLNRIFGNRLHPLLLSALHLLVDKDRIDHYPAIAARLSERVDEERGFVRGKVFTAIPLSGDGHHYIQEKLEAFSGLKFHLDFQVEPALIGGVRVTYGDVLLDTSVRSRLKELGERLHHLKIV